MSRGKKYQPEQVVNLLRQIEVAVANGKTTAQASKEASIVERREIALAQMPPLLLELWRERHPSA